MRLLRTFELDLPSGERMSDFLRERLDWRRERRLRPGNRPAFADRCRRAKFERLARLETRRHVRRRLLGNRPPDRRQCCSRIRRTREARRRSSWTARCPIYPLGAVFGAVVPATLLFSDKKRPKQLREWLTRNCQLGEVSLFPDGIFTFADQECTVLLGRRMPEGAPTRSMSTRLRRVRECDREGFRRDYKFTTSRIRPQSGFDQGPENPLWIPEFDEEIWEWIDSCPKLGSMAVVGQGMRYLGISSIKNVRTIEKKPFPGSLEGYHFLKGQWLIHQHPPVCYFNPDAALVGRPRSGLDRLPQVLVNYAPTSRGKWRLKPFIDYTGRVFSGNLFCVRPRDAGIPLEFLWAIMISPLANLFAQTHLLKRHVLTGAIELSSRSKI